MLFINTAFEVTSCLEQVHMLQVQCLRVSRPASTLVKIAYRRVIMPWSTDSIVNRVLAPPSEAIFYVKRKSNWHGVRQLTPV